MSSSSSCFLLSLPPEAQLQPPLDQLDNLQTKNDFSLPTISNKQTQSNSIEMSLQLESPNNVWLFAVKGILLLLSLHSLGAVCFRIVRVLHQLTRFGRKLKSKEEPLTSTLPTSKTLHSNDLKQEDLAQVRLISLFMLSISLLVSLLQITVVWFDHFASICCSTAFALVALIGDFKSSHDPTGQLNLVISLLSKLMFAVLFILKKSNLYMYTSRPRRRFSLQQRRPLNTYTVGR